MRKVYLIISMRMIPYAIFIGTAMPEKKEFAVAGMGIKFGCIDFL